MNTKRLTNLALLIAVYVVLAVMTPIRLINFKFTFEAFPVLIAGILMGAADGCLVGLLGSAIYQIFASGYGITLTTPLWILPHALSGFLVGLLAEKWRDKLDFVHLTFICSLSSLCVTAFNTLALYVDSRMFGYYSKKLVFGALFVKIVTGILLAVIYSLILPKLIDRLKRVVK